MSATLDLTVFSSPQRAHENGKVELLHALPLVYMNLKIIFGTIVVVALFFFGFIFATATSYWPTGLIVSAMLFVVGFGIIFFISRKPKTIVQQLEVSGEMKAVALKCPNCSASVDANQIKIVSGVPYATCKYCGNMFEVTEEPKW